MSSIPSDIAIITGPTMVGICLNWGFMGVLLVQLYYYNENFYDDRRLIKLLVYGLALLDILQTIMVTADAFHWFVYGFGNMAQLDQTFLNSWDVPVLDAIISLVVQAFYCWRIYFLRKTFIIPVLILLVSLAQCAAGIYTGIRAHQLGHLSLISTEVVPQTIWLVGGAVADVAIAGVLSWTLLYQRNTAARSSITHSVMARIIRLVVETNALTAGVAVLALILFWGVPQHSTLVVPPTAIIGKLYTNCLIALFNNRAKEMKSQSAHGMQSERSQVHSRHNHNNSVKVHVVREMDMSFEGQMELGNLQIRRDPNFKNLKVQSRKGVWDISWVL
ncbi:hypothetical protein B0H14DRAFT_3147033 [Mycena olivaceomarginata]|nr:hypothetical protein B0H14DRAFT_3147033 [Mycena olivaceomarginata]